MENLCNCGINCNCGKIENFCGVYTDIFEDDLMADFNEK